jgi:hypothetical protein
VSYTPILPYGGSDGWGYLKQTLDSQRAAHDDALPTIVKLDLATFRAQIAQATSAEKVADDPLFRKVALAAFGLGDAKPTRAFLIKALTTATSGSGAEKAFADPRWFELAKAFGFGDGTPKTGEPGFGDTVVARYRLQRFDETVGAASPEMRRALAFDRATASLAAAGFDETAGWERALADPAVAPVLKQAFGLGPRFDAMPKAEQVQTLRKAVEPVTGTRTVDALADADLRDAVLDRYFAAARGSTTPGSLRPQTGQGGLAGWRVLQSSLDRQQTAFDRATARDPDLRHFAAKVGAALTAADFVKDERLVGVALEAFGLGQTKPTAAFLQRVLESDTASATSFASQQADPRWRELAAAFGYGDGGGARVQEFGFADEIAGRWRLNGFEEAVGAQDDDLRIGLILDRTLESLAGAGLSAIEGWRRALGNPTVALGLARGLGLGDDFAGLDSAAQIAAVREKAKALTGSDRIDAFAADAPRETLIRRFLSSADDTARPRGLGQPVIPLQGVAGWAFLKRTLTSQQESFAASASVKREMDYFRDNIGSITSAEDLVADRRLLTVALEAFGMADEIGKKAFIEKALREGTETQGALAVRMVDSRYREFVATFGFGDGRGAQTGVDGFADRILARYKVRAFETAVGGVDESMRLALNFDRSMKAMATAGGSENAAWFRVIGDVPLRRVLEGAFGLPTNFAKLDVDRQVAVLRERTGRLTGQQSIKSFADGTSRETLIRRFLVREQTGDAGSAASRGLTALGLLQQIPRQTLNLRR